MRRRRKRRSTKFQQSLKKTHAMRRKVPVDLRPLFDHAVHLAVDAHQKSSRPGRTYLAKRAGLDLLYARRLARKS